ncbi:MAG: hypothetical protein NTW28_30450, partial [Candidatus Solibacter sp.]|nr:hypothetical protein [Candidatus Solibacter sp.]
MKATSSATGITAITVTASPGKYIDGKGGLRQVDTPLSLTADAKAYKTQYSFDRGTMASAVSDLQVFASQERKLKTVTMQPAIMARAVATLTARLTAATSKLPVFGDKVEAANWAQVDNLDMAHPEMAEKVGEILIGSMKATTVPAEVQLYLYVTLDSGVPALQVKFTAPSPVADGIPGRQIHPPGDVESVLDPSGAEVPGSVRNLQKAVWAPYQSAECPHPNSGEVCLGMLGVSASHVFVCPDFREQIEFT